MRFTVFEVRGFPYGISRFGVLRYKVFPCGVSRFAVCLTGFRGSGFRVRGFPCEVLRCQVSGSGIWVWVMGFGVSRFEVFEVRGLPYRVSWFGV